MRHPRYSFSVTLISITPQDFPSPPGYTLVVRLDPTTNLKIFVSADQLNADFAGKVIPNVKEGDVMELSLAIPVSLQ